MGVQVVTQEELLLVLVLTAKCVHAGAYSTVIQKGCDGNTENLIPFTFFTCPHSLTEEDTLNAFQALLRPSLCVYRA